VSQEVISVEQKSNVAIDITKTVPFLELEANIEELGEDDVVFKSRIKY
jgi:hypothetical protein